MASETELDTFIKKFKDLWKSGIGAHLDIDTHAGEAWVGLRVRLGHAPGPPHYQVQVQERARNGPSRQQRRERRAQERKQVEAEEASKAVSENETDSVEEVMELATADVVISNLNYLSSNADAEIDYSCDFCETKFSSLRAVQIHIGKKHKVTGSPIPQVDGFVTQKLHSVLSVTSTRRTSNTPFRSSFQIMWKLSWCQWLELVGCRVRINSVHF